MSPPCATPSTGSFARAAAGAAAALSGVGIRTPEGLTATFGVPPRTAAAVKGVGRLPRQPRSGAVTVTATATATAPAIAAAVHWTTDASSAILSQLAAAAAVAVVVEVPLLPEAGTTERETEVASQEAGVPRMVPGTWWTQGVALEAATTEASPRSSGTALAALFPFPPPRLSSQETGTEAARAAAAGQMIATGVATVAAVMAAEAASHVPAAVPEEGTPSPAMTAPLLATANSKTASITDTRGWARAGVPEGEGEAAGLPPRAVMVTATGAFHHRAADLGLLPAMGGLRTRTDRVEAVVVAGASTTDDSTPRATHPQTITTAAPVVPGTTTASSPSGRLTAATIPTTAGSVINGLRDTWSRERERERRCHCHGGEETRGMLEETTETREETTETETGTCEETTETLEETTETLEETTETLEETTETETGTCEETTEIATGRAPSPTSPTSTATPTRWCLPSTRRAVTAWWSATR